MRRTEFLGVRRTKGAAASTCAVSSAVALALLSFFDELAQRRTVAFGICILVAAGSLVAVYRLAPERPFTVLNVFTMLFVLFHFGLVIPEWVGLNNQALSPEGLGWFEGELAVRAVLLSSLGLCALTCGAAAVGLRTPGATAGPNPDRNIRHAWSGRIGLVTTLAGCLLWTLAVLVQGQVDVTGSYSEFRSATAGAPLPWAYLLIGLGMPFLATAEARATRVSGVVVFSVYAALALAVGARSETFIPALGYLVVRARVTDIRLTLSKVVVPVLLLSLISVIRQFRASGIGAFAMKDAALSPVSGLTELGYSLRPVVAALEWHDVDGERLFGIQTYVGQLGRSVIGRAMGITALPTAQDLSVLSTAVMARIGPIGGSQIAEAYRSGAQLGVLLVMFSLGASMAWLDRRPCRGEWNAAVGAIAVVLFVWVRNDVTPVIFDLLVIGATASLVWFLDRLTALRAPYRRPTVSDRIAS